MEVKECKKLNEKLYIEKLDSGLTVIVFPKKNVMKKYAIIGTYFGSVDNHFKVDGREVQVPDGVAHFLEHKMFEQKSGKNALDTLMALGIDANAYTTNDHTAYLFETSDNFYEGLDELMDYVQNPYFTDENVEKEKGIISQEIKMYDDDPGWQLYMSTMNALYKKSAMKIDVAGTVESISKIKPETLYECYNTFYDLSNMVMVVCGDFEPKSIINEIKKRIIKKTENKKIERIYPEKENANDLNEKKIERTFDVSLPLFSIAFKDKVENNIDIEKQQLGISILLDLLIGKSSKLYKELYEDGIIFSELDGDYEYSQQYAHILISGQSIDTNKVYNKIREQIEDFENNGINENDLKRIIKKHYGDIVSQYNNVGEIARNVLVDYLKGADSFSYIEKCNEINKEYIETLLNEKFSEDRMVFITLKKK